jgi:hypothetical protein
VHPEGFGDFADELPLIYQAFSKIRLLWVELPGPTEPHTFPLRYYPPGGRPLSNQVPFELGVLRRTAIRRLCGVRDYAKPQR